MSGWGLGGVVWRGGGGREGRRGIIPVGWKGKYRVMTKKLELMAIFFFYPKTETSLRATFLPLANSEVLF